MTVSCIFHYISQCNNNRNKVHNKCNVLESSPNHPPSPVLGKIVFHKTSLRCQKSWGPLLIQHTSLRVVYTLFSVLLYSYLLFCPARHQNCSCPVWQHCQTVICHIVVFQFSSYFTGHRWLLPVKIYLSWLPGYHTLLGFFLFHSPVLLLIPVIPLPC